MKVDRSVCRVGCDLQGGKSFMENIPLGHRFYYFSSEFPQMLSEYTFFSNIF